MKKVNKPIKILLLCIMTAIIAIVFVACNDVSDHTDDVQIIFHLEGGTYQNCTLPVYTYYSFAPGTQNLIMDPTTFSKVEITRAGYVLEGWYQTKTINDEEAVYSDKWDFETDTVGDDGVTLYAYWTKAIKYSYNVCYYDGEDVVTVGTYPVNEGEEFADYSNYATKRFGYTALGFLDEHGNPWNASFQHPGGDVDLAINVFVDYIEGTFALVRTAAELKSAKNRNIYLMNNIDFEGGDFSFDNYRGTLLGNDYTISNFNLQCGSARNGGATRDDLKADLIDENNQSWYVSLFESLDGATIKDVSFENITIKILATLAMIDKIYLVPLSPTITDTTIENVDFSATYVIDSLPVEFNDEENLIIVDDRAYYEMEGSTVITDVNVSLSLQENEAA